MCPCRAKLNSLPLFFSINLRKSYTAHNVGIWQSVPPFPGYAKSDFYLDKVKILFIFSAFEKSRLESEKINQKSKSGTEDIFWGTVEPPVPTALSGDPTDFHSVRRGGLGWLNQRLAISLLHLVVKSEILGELLLLRRP